MPVLKHAIALATLLLMACSSAPRPVTVDIVALNDLHGYLQANHWSYKDASGVTHTLEAGGLPTLGGMLAQLRQEDPQLLFIGAGDMIGASPPLSSLWADEPTLLALRSLHLTFSTLGNHELDNGKAEFLRQMQGGCASARPDKACQFHRDYPGTGFPYIAANLIDTDTGQPLLPAYHIETVKGVRVAFVGAVLRDVDKVVSIKGMQGLRASDEAEAINRVIPELKAQGVNAIIAVVHQGGETPEPYDKQDCQQLHGDIVDVARRLDPAVDVLITGHSHQGYLCRIGRLLVTQGSSYGHLLTHLSLEVTPGTHQVTAVHAENLLADPARYPPDPAMVALLQEVEQRSNARLMQPVGRLAVPAVTNVAQPSGESALGDLIADAQLAGTRALGAQVALTNPGGIRNSLSLAPGQQQLTYAQVASVQPFSNTLVLVDLSGDQLRQLLEQQWQADRFRPLQVSAGFSYQWDAGRPMGSRVVPGSLSFNGQPVQPQQSYRVTMNSFLADGGDGFTLFTHGARRMDSGLSDLTVLIDYLKGRGSSGAVQVAGRIVRVH